MCRQLGWVWIDQDAAEFATHHGNFARVLHFAEFIFDFVSQATQVSRAIVWAGRRQRQGDNRHIVDLDGLDGPVFHTRRDDILVGH